MGIRRNTVRKVVCNLEKYRGLEIHKLYASQGILQIQALIDYVWRRTQN